MPKRENYLNWDEYFMWIAILSAQRSKDPSTQVWACIVDHKNRIIGTGYNWLPIWCNDDEYPWERKWEFLETKYPYVCHAEANAILNNFGKNLEWAKIYVALFPCNECAKLIIQSGIKEVIYLSDKYSDLDIFKASRKMLNSSNIKLTQLKPEKKTVTLSFENI